MSVVFEAFPTAVDFSSRTPRYGPLRGVKRRSLENCLRFTVHACFISLRRKRPVTGTGNRLDVCVCVKLVAYILHTKKTTLDV